MENNIINILELNGLIVMAFGFVIIALAIHRKKLRNNIKGLSKIVATDRASFTPKAEQIMQTIGLSLFIVGAITLMVSAVVSHVPAA
ncbi:hypothetical protein QWY86_12725 [Pedobacter aquatilis]|uniref:hypothetical protein n=1 Tax=Pedobacter aquatilis TaxID=351343 RepID=UPI0025B2C0C3|nr:hypothetical protein [Pedobacter aquatilis]MDN3587539.1 hypothetical protein [Pedobacter aquatilis]